MKLGVNEMFYQLTRYIKIKFIMKRKMIKEAFVGSGKTDKKTEMVACYEKR